MNKLPFGLYFGLPGFYQQYNTNRFRNRKDRITRAAVKRRRKIEKRIGKYEADKLSEAFMRKVRL